MSISLFGWLDKISFWRDLPYPLKGALLRAFKAALSAAVGVLLTAAGAGILFPATWSPMIILIVTATLQAVDKFLREKDAANELGDTVLVDSISHTSTPPVPNGATDTTTIPPVEPTPEPDPVVEPDPVNDPVPVDDPTIDIGTSDTDLPQP